MIDSNYNTKYFILNAHDIKMSKLSSFADKQMSTCSSYLRTSHSVHVKLIGDGNILLFESYQESMSCNALCYDLNADIFIFVCVDQGKANRNYLWRCAERAIETDINSLSVASETKICRGFLNSFSLNSC